MFFVGYFGAERIWFARLFNGETLDRQGIWKWSWHLWPRYAGLGLIAALIMLPLAILVFARTIQVIGEISEEARTDVEREFGGPADPQQVSQEIQRRMEERLGVAGDPRKASRVLLTPTFVVMSVVLGLFLDFLLTFATPALAFTTSGPIKAIKHGLRTMRQSFPGSLLYVAIPPFAALLTLRLLPVTTFRLGVYIALSAIGALLNLWFKGATVAFYLRQQASMGGPVGH